MCAVGWVSEDNDVIGLSIVKEGYCVMGAVAIQEENIGTSSCFLFSLSIKVLNYPIQG